ncbi:MAG: hypothetical protein AB1349_05770 [Elusimicrobiota bacterium]
MKKIGCCVPLVTYLLLPVIVSFCFAEKLPVQVDDVSIEHTAMTTQVILKVSHEFNYNAEDFAAQNKYVIAVNIQDAIHYKPYRTITVNRGIVESVWAGQYKTDPQIARVVVYLTEKPNYKIVQENKKLKISIDNNYSTKAPAKPVHPKPIKNWQERIVSLNFKDIELVDILKLIAKQNNLNFVIGDEVKGLVTISLDNVKLKTALDTILAIHEFAYIETDNIIRIVPKAEKKPETQIFQLKYVQAKDIMSKIQPNLSSTAKLQTDDRTNTMILSTTEFEDFCICEKLIQQLDKQIPQVLIKAKIVEVTLDESDNLGIQWDVTVKTSIKNVSSGKATVGVDVGNLNISTLDETQFSAVLSLLSTKIKGNLLSSPEIVTLDNQSATINVGRKIAYREITQTSAGTVYETKFIDVGTMLNVTPHIHGTDMLSLELHPEVSDLTGYTPDNQPLIGTKEATTKVTVKEGQTIVIGGLITEQFLKTIAGVPLLKDIPVLKYLFSKQVDQKVKTNLLIFVTPYILDVEKIEKYYKDKTDTIHK